MVMNNVKETATTLRVLYPIWIVISIFSMIYVPSQLITNDVAETVRNIASNEFLFRSAILAGVLTHLFHVFVVILFRLLFQEKGDPVCVSNLTIFGLLSVPIALGGSVAGLAILDNLSDPSVVAGYLGWMKNSETIASLFWGMWLFPLGNLAVNTGYFPMFTKWALWITGFGYLISVVVKTVAPEQTSILAATDIMAMGELVFILWFVVFGIKTQSE
jgi:hypothetical protein